MHAEGGPLGTESGIRSVGAFRGSCRRGRIGPIQLKGGEMSSSVAVASMIVMIGVVGYLVWALLRSIREEQRRSGVRKVWPNFALSIALLTLFAVSWLAH